jgi:hypothetical protein
MAFYQRIDGYRRTRDSYTRIFSQIDRARTLAVRANRLGDQITARDLELLAARLEAIALQFNDLELGVARKTALRADQAIRQRIDATRVRPRRPGGKSGQLSSRIKSEPLPSRPLALGQVGIARMEELDKVVNPDFPNAKAYWRAQEYGYDFSQHPRDKRGNVAIRGFFQPGNAPANGGQFRQHPYFETAQGAPRMVIRRPVPARHFLRDGTDNAVNYWHAEQQAVQRTIVAELRRL